MPRWVGSARSYLGLGDRWGFTRGGNINEVLDGVIPVSVVETLLDDVDGSYQALSATPTLGGVGFHGTFGAIMFGNVDATMLIHQLVWNGGTVSQNPPYPVTYDLFTPTAPYNPVQLNPTLHTPGGLVTNKNFTFGGGFALSGYQIAPYTSAAPFTRGHRIQHTTVTPDAGVVGPNQAVQGTTTSSHQQAAPQSGAPIVTLGGTIVFDPPMRIYTDRFFAIQSMVALANAEPIFTASILYTEQPNLRDN